MWQLCAFLPFSLLSEPGANRQLVVEAAHRCALAVHSVSFDSKERSSTGDGRPNRSRSFSFRAKGALFHARTVFDPNENLQEFTTAYDGRKYQTLSQGSLTLTDQPQVPNVYVGLNPISLIYHFLWDGKSEYHWNMARNRKLWDDRFREASLKPQEGELASQTTLSVPNAIDGFTSLVTFDSARGGFPVRSRMLFEGKPMAELEVTEFKAFEVDGLQVFFPTKVNSAKSGDERLAISFEIDPLTLKVNPPLEDDQFAISPASIDLVSTRGMPERVRPGVHVSRGAEASRAAGDWSLKNLVTAFGSICAAAAIGGALLLWRSRFGT